MSAVIDSADAVESITDYDLVVTSPGLPPDRAGAGRGRRGGRADLGRRRIGLAAGQFRPLRAAAALAGRHRHQRQDHDDVDAARDAGRRGPPQPAVRKHRRSGARRARRTGRFPGGRTVQLPIALGAVAAPGGGCGAQRRRGPPGLARLDGGLRRATRPACSTGGSPSSGSTTRSRPGCWTPRPPRCGSASGWANRRPANSVSRDGVLVDNAFGDGVALAETAAIPVAGPVGVLDALAAAALARAVDVPPEAIAEALAAFEVGRHRAEVVADARRRHLRRRLQGHQPACRAGVDRGLPAGGLDRRRSAQGRVGRRTRHRRWRIGWSERC